jgi:CPA1 family monovalent cation:H+ antiporter
MFWGGLRGAIAIAIVLSLPDFEYAETFIALVMGVVLFTLLVQGLTIEPLMRWLGLDQPPLVDRLTMLERNLLGRQKAMRRIPNLVAGGLFSAPISRRLQQECEHDIAKTQLQLDSMRREELNEADELNYLYLNAFAEEKSLYDRLYSKGHLSEGAYRELVLVLELQIDAIRHSGAFEHVHSHRLRRLMERGIYTLLDRYAFFAPLAERLRMMRIVRNYEEVWGHYQGSQRVLDYLEELQQLESTPEHLVKEVASHYRHWHELAKQQINMVSESFPEFVTSMQQRLGQRLVLLAEADATRELEDRGMLPHGRSEEHLQQIAEQLNALRGHSIEKLEPNPRELLQRVPLFQGLDTSGFGHLEEMVRKHTLPAGEDIIRQGDSGDSLFLIARGVVRVLREEDGELNELGTLMAGDFFGEMALMHHECRNATVRSVSPCILYELKRSDLEGLMAQKPQIAAALRKADKARSKALHPVTSEGRE